MPTLHIELHPGRSQEQKRALAREVTRATVETLNCPPDSVQIVLTEISKEAWAVGGILKSDQA